MRSGHRQYAGADRRDCVPTGGGNEGPNLRGSEVSHRSPSQVYEIKAAPILLPHGHSIASARRFRISADDLVVLPRLRVTVSSFDGAHTLLIASKREGMERASILDDKQGGGGYDEPEDEGYLGSISKWWGGADPGAPTDGEQVRISDEISTVTSAASRPHLGCISAASRPHLGRISGAHLLARVWPSVRAISQDHDAVGPRAH